MEAPAPDAPALEALAPERPSRRSRRDWVADSVLFGLALGYGLVTSAERLRAGSLLVPTWLFDLDQVVGVLGCAALWWRRRWPTQLALILIALSAVFEMVAGAMLVALFTVAIHCRPRTTALVFGASIASAVIYVILRPEPGVPAWLLFTLGLTLQGAAVGWELAIRHRRELRLAAQERIDRVAEEARLRAEQAEYETGDALAREIHDVLGHRLSLLSVHAGALEYNPHATPEEVSQAARVIRENAHQALQDLREVIGVLRTPDGDRSLLSISAVGRLAIESELAGMAVSVQDEISGSPPEELSHTVYRIVQEGLTNARKHSPGLPVDVRLSGAPGPGLTVEVRNPGSAVPAESGQRSGVGHHGHGLAGLSERVTSLDGRLNYGPSADGGWHLVAWLPWPA